MSDARPFQAEIASPSVATALPAVAVMMAAAVAAAGCAAAGSIFAAAVTALLGLGCAASLTVALRRLAVRDSQVSLYEGWINQITGFAVMRLDMRGTIIAANEGGSSIHGYATADLLGRNVSCFYPKPNRATNSRRMRFDSQPRMARTKIADGVSEKTAPGSGAVSR